MTYFAVIMARRIWRTVQGNLKQLKKVYEITNLYIRLVRQLCIPVNGPPVLARKLIACFFLISFINSARHPHHQNGHGGIFAIQWPKPSSARGSSPLLVGDVSAVSDVLHRLPTRVLSYMEVLFRGRYFVANSPQLKSTLIKFYKPKQQLVTSL
jgi:hypothetical protein